ncbi:MAG TPA: adenylate/guanylate cyclase domain-containing protein, partial [Acidimicrobiales bacterium]|nr:adenylate/guanylate cyclase domain-containing protein [Acidimicrobiales bacterium]
MAEAQTVAVLFTDLVGSTARQSEVGDERFDEIRRAHFAVLRDVVEAHQGTEVKNLGDGLMVVFRSASNAIAAAVAMQVENDRHGRAHPDLAVGIKVAAAMGDAVLEEDDWFGTPVVEAARLCAVCDSGQVLVTESLRLMAGSRSGAPIERLGDLELKGLPDPVPTCTVRWEPAEVVAGIPLPGLFAGDGAAPFAGRAAERATLDRLWKEARTTGRRVAFVAGEPGIGKTRLVAELARDVHAEGGVVLVGRSDDEIDVPYRPFADALDHLARHADDDLLTEHAEEMGGVVGRLAPTLTRRTRVEPEPMSNDPEMERVRQFHAVADLLTR